MAQQENGAKEAEQRRKPSDCVNNRSGHLASQRRVRSRDPLARNHEDEFVPDGQITKNSSTPIAKIFRFPRRANQFYQLAPSRSERGALAIVTNVGMGCGGRKSVGRDRRAGLP